MAQDGEASIRAAFEAEQRKPPAERDPRVAFEHGRQLALSSSMADLEQSIRLLEGVLQLKVRASLAAWAGSSSRVLTLVSRCWSFQSREHEEGCLYYLARAQRQCGVRSPASAGRRFLQWSRAQELKQARQYLELGLERHPGSDRISEELQDLNGQVQRGETLSAIPHGR